MKNIGGCISPTLSNSSKEKKTTRLCATETASERKQLQQAGPSCGSAADAMEERTCRADESDVSTTGKWREQQSKNLKTRNSRLVTQSVRGKNKESVCLGTSWPPRQPHYDQHWAIYTCAHIRRHSWKIHSLPATHHTPAGKQEKGVTRRRHEILRGHQRWWEIIKHS